MLSLVCPVLKGLGNVVDSSRMPRMAFGQPFASQPESTKKTMFFQSFIGILGTAWRKTAHVSDERTDAELIHTDEE
jgi:hypothetical protein